MELSFLRGVVSQHGSSADESNVFQSVTHRCGYLLYFAITDSRLRLGLYDPNKYFQIMPCEQVSNKSATFVLTN